MRDDHARNAEKDPNNKGAKRRAESRTRAAPRRFIRIINIYFQIYIYIEIYIYIYIYYY